eukprot:763046-Hanusia_phi.AAC.1
MASMEERRRQWRGRGLNENDDSSAIEISISKERHRWRKIISKISMFNVHVGHNSTRKLWRLAVPKNQLGKELLSLLHLCGLSLPLWPLLGQAILNLLTARIIRDLKTFYSTILRPCQHTMHQKIFDIRPQGPAG